MSTIQHRERVPFFQFLPAGLFGGIMGLTGLSLAWTLAGKQWGLPSWPGTCIGILAIVFFLVLLAAYLNKWRMYPDLVRAEFKHPVTGCLFGTIPIVLLLLPGIILHYNIVLAKWIWVIGSISMLGFAWLIMRRWLDNRQEPANAVPAWILPVVGTLDVPIIGTHFLEVPGVHEICLFFFGVGLLFTIILLTIIIARLIFLPPLPEAIQPSLMILVGPLALAFTDYENLAGREDMISSIFLYFDLFLLLLLGSKLMLLAKCCPFRIGWWAVSFPLVALTGATLRYSASHPGWLLLGIAGFMLALSTGVIGYMLTVTLHRIVKGDLFVENAPNVPIAGK